MPYAWKQLRFDVPAGLVDQSVLTFNDESNTFQISITSDERGATALGAYVDAQLKDVAQALPGYQLVSKRERKVNGRDAFVVEHKAQAKSGAMRQLQAYVDVGANGVTAIVTASHLDKPQKQSAVEAAKGTASSAAVDTAFEKILSTLSIQAGA